MEHYLPHDAWIEAFLLRDGFPDNKDYGGSFDNIPVGEGEAAMYQPFVNAVNSLGVLDGFVLANGFGKPDSTGKTVTHCGMVYAKDCPAVIDGANVIATT
ncbi:hypothetical protein NUW54_g8232 [Trametes sanguinea]|uniref:Uncharacterized protein n=1 Tax=Trametes sanguinea TaxID=158606 RepID=A0ACC1PEY0_9APHY|nr:hypothetical protein NUW54_g8232 [Trametes sanguinea]